MSVLWAVIIILLVLWLLGYFAFSIGGALVHLLLVVAVIVLIYQVLMRRRSF